MEENTPAPISTPAKKNNNAVFGLLFIIIVIVIITGTTIYESKTKQINSSMIEGTTSIQKSINASPTISQKKSAFKDGTYSADGSYLTHADTETLGVTITLQHDVITDVSLTEKPTDDISRMHQDDFAANYKQFVVGKNIASVHLDKISRSSLTPIGFNDALQKIEQQAKS